MPELTPGERRGAFLLAVLLALGAAHDAWRAHRPPAPLPPAAPGPPAPPAAAAPAPAAPADPATAAPADSTPATPRGRGRKPLPAPGSVDPNRATAAQLATLPGIGPVLAQRIVAHRREHGPFRSPEELRAVRGIGPRLFARLRPYLRDRPADAAAP